MSAQHRSRERERLEAIVRAELAGPVLEGALRVANEIRARHGEAVVALLFYGSCLRRGTVEGVLDFYAITSDYRGAYRSRWPALLGGALPPNVHYIELPADDLRAKYALISLADFAQRAAGASFDCRVWSRFCQPARIAWARDDATRAALVAASANAALTMSARMLAWAPGAQRERTLDAQALWARGFDETYRAELRSEQPASIAVIPAADPERYDAVLRAALGVLAERGELELIGSEPGVLRIAQPPRALAAARRAWRVRRTLAKVLAVASLLKTAFTFEGWLPYVVWKIERHSGQRIALSDRQRRRPLLYAWPVIVRLLRSGALR
ncbi:MAG TPA: hypothetical protein VFT98_06270 [Myxococcota bacterium]|nr:hypothetical protein [Myxococcota bacterium]